VSKTRDHSDQNLLFFKVF